MIIACQNNHLEIVQWLHTHGAATDVTRPDNDGFTPMYIACQNGHLEIVRWLHAHGADTDVMRPSFHGMTPIFIACSKGHLNVVKHLIHHHRIPHDTLEQWYPELSSSNKRQLRQAARENVFDCQSFFTLRTIVCCINIEPYQVMNEENPGRLVVSSSSLLSFRSIDDHVFLDRIADYICGDKRTRKMWCLIQKKRLFMSDLEQQDWIQNL